MSASCVGINIFSLLSNKESSSPNELSENPEKSLLDLLLLNFSVLECKVQSWE